MKVKADRLVVPLKEHGFCRGYPTYAKDSFTFVRSRSYGELYESIIVESQGSEDEAVYASVGVSLTRTVMYKVLGDVKLLDELAEDRERGWTIIRDVEKARKWERELVRIGPRRACEWAEFREKFLLESTEEVRTAVRKYLTIVEPIIDIDHSYQRVFESCDDQIVDEAKRIEVGGVLGERVYQLACLIILRHSEQAENGRSFLGCNAALDTDFTDRVKILADKLVQAT